jgi:hypothetical protein
MQTKEWRAPPQTGLCLVLDQRIAALLLPLATLQERQANLFLEPPVAAHPFERPSALPPSVAMCPRAPCTAVPGKQSPHLYSASNAGEHACSVTCHGYTGQSLHSSCEHYNKEYPSRRLELILRTFRSAISCCLLDASFETASSIRRPVSSSSSW